MDPSISVPPSERVALAVLQAERGHWDDLLGPEPLGYQTAKEAGSLALVEFMEPYRMCATNFIFCSVDFYEQRYYGNEDEYIASRIRDWLPVMCEKIRKRKEPKTYWRMFCEAFDADGFFRAVLIGHVIGELVASLFQ